MTMLKRIKPSRAMAVALLALFVSLGGGAYAATNLPANSVGTAQLRNQAVNVHKLAFNAVGTRRIQDGAVNVHKLAFNAVGTRRIQDGAVNNSKLQNGAVTSEKVKDHSLLASDFAAGQLPHGPEGPQGQQGPPGPGAPGGATWAVVNSNAAVIASSASWDGRSVTHVATGHYCVTPVTTSIWIVPDLHGSDPVVANVTGGTTGCNAGFGNVWLSDTKTGALVDNVFTVFVAP